MQPFYFTTSWDDGSADDLRVAELLAKHNLKGTFYIPIEFPFVKGKYSAYKKLTPADLQRLARMQEIGSHSYTHRRLDQLSSPELAHEVGDSKYELETTIGRPISLFCYPQGFLSDTVVAATREAGYAGGRTTQNFAFQLPTDPYRIPVTLRIGSYPFRKTDTTHWYWRHLLQPLFGYRKQFVKHPSWLAASYSWQSFARAIFMYAHGHGNYFHLYGHSWEIEKYGLWKDLDSFLGFVQQQKTISAITNGEIVDLIQRNTTP